MGGKHLWGPAGGTAPAVDERTDAVRIAEREDTETGDQDGHGIGAAAAPVHGLHRLEHLLGRELEVREVSGIGMTTSMS